MKFIFNTNNALAVVRIITGLLVAYHGLEIFDGVKMQEYQTWDSIKALPGANVMVYTGKAIELAGGLALALGLFARAAAAGIMVVMLFICFYLGNGKFWYEDQHPFLLALLSVLYCMSGAGTWSIDQKWRNKN